MKLKIFTDGGARGNPGPAAVGVVAKDENNQIIFQFGKTIGVATNNVAEYTAVAEALKGVRERELKPPEGIEFFADSQLVVSQLSGLFRIKNAQLRQLLILIRQLEQEVGGNISYRSIPREQNKEADSLVNKALDEQRI